MASTDPTVRTTEELSALVLEEPPTYGELEAALTEWHRRWVEEPERFVDEATALATDPETYGGSAGPYLVELILELRGE